MKSAAEIDREASDLVKFTSAMGEDGMKKLNELTAATIDSSETNLFMFNPRMSYVLEDWIKADPEFWKPKPAAAAAAKPAKKPAAQYGWRGAMGCGVQRRILPVRAGGLRSFA